MIIRCLLSILLCFVMPAHAVTVLDVSPLHATPQDVIRATVHFNAGQSVEAVRTYRYGNSIHVFVLMDDTLNPFEPPAPESTQTFDLGRYPVGEYRIDIYNGNLYPSAPMATRQLGVVARTGIPAASSSALAALILLTLVAGFVAVRRQRADGP